MNKDLKDPAWDADEPHGLGVHCANCGGDWWWIESEPYLPDEFHVMVTCGDCYDRGAHVGTGPSLPEALQDWQEHYTEKGLEAWTSKSK
jgi:hypothetical protein